MIELVGIGEGYEYQHNTTKNRKSNIRNPWKFKIRDTFRTDHVHEQITLLHSTCKIEFKRREIII